MADGLAKDDAAGRRRTLFRLQLAAARARSVTDELFVHDAGVTMAQAAALALIAQHGGCSQRFLADRLRQRESAITTMVRRLEAAGLVERRPSTADARSWELWTTRRGRSAVVGLESARSTVNEALERAVGPFGIDAFTDALEAVERELAALLANEQPAGCDRGRRSTR